MCSWKEDRSGNVLKLVSGPISAPQSPDKIFSFLLVLFFCGSSPKEDPGKQEAAVSNVDSWGLGLFPYRLTFVLM